jgi:hypothetical protein
MRKYILIILGIVLAVYPIAHTYFYMNYTLMRGFFDAYDTKGKGLTIDFSESMAAPPIIRIQFVYDAILTGNGMRSIVETQEYDSKFGIVGYFNNRYQVQCHKSGIPESDFAFMNCMTEVKKRLYFVVKNKKSQLQETVNVLNVMV